jgi:hypothetical protein
MTAPTVKQSNDYDGTSTWANNGVQVQTVPNTLPSAVTAGNGLVVFQTIADYSIIHNDTTCTDSLSTDYGTKLNQENSSATGGAQSVVSWIGTASASGADTITNAFSAVGDIEGWQANFVSEIANYGGLVGHAGSVQNGLAHGANNIVAGTIAVQASDLPCLLIGLSMNTSSNSGHPATANSQPPTAGTGMTLLANAWAFGNGGGFSGYTASVFTQAITVAGSYGLVANQASTSAEDVVSVALIVRGTAAQSTVPNVVGDTQATATAAIISAGLTLGAVTTQSSSVVQAGNVISENPAAGTQVGSGSGVSIVVSTGPVVSNTAPLAWFN